MSITYEGIILFGVVFFFGYGFSALTQYKAEQGPWRWAFQAFMFLVLAAYFTWFWSEGRRTLPMKTISVRVVDARGRPVSRVRAFARFCVASAMLVAAVGASASLHPAFGLLALLPLGWTVVDRRRRALYDVACGTELVLDAGEARKRGR
jgi:uncharacterized RDD family membrane protein YckC